MNVFEGIAIIGGIVFMGYLIFLVYAISVSDGKRN